MFIIRPLALIALIQADPSSTHDLGLKVLAAQPAPELNALFEQRVGWIGGDGVYSVPLAPGRSLWLFSDTWVGKVREGKRTDATIVNNTAARLEEGRSPQFFIQHDSKGKPTALFTPAQGSGWFWPQAATFHDGKLYVFLTQVEKTGNGGAFGFRLTGQSLAIVTNPAEAPTQWRMEQFKIPYAQMSRQRELTFGAAVLSEGEFLYIYGIDDVARAGFRQKRLVLARAPVRSLADFREWRFYHDGRCLGDCSKADKLAEGLANECSVSYLPALHRYVLIYTETGLSPRILARTAGKPWGPWSPPTVLYQCPEVNWDKKIFCYAAKAHPELAKDDELVISYVANSFDFWQVAGDARLYWPRFIRVRLAAALQ